MATFTNQQIQSGIDRRQQSDGERKALADQIRSLAARQQDWTPADRQAWDQLNIRYDEKSLEHRKMSARLRGQGYDNDSRNSDWHGGGGSGGTLDRALNAWALNAMGKSVSPAQADACNDYGIALNSGAFSIQLPTHGPTNGARLFRNAMSTGEISEGASVIPEGFIPRLERALLSFAGVMQAADVMTTDSGNDLPWPTADDSENVGALLGENTAAGDSGVDPKFGRVTFGAFVITSNVIRVPNPLIEDSGIDLSSVLGDMCGERIGRCLSPLLTSGTGGNQPSGILTGAVAGLTAASPTTITFDDLFDLESSIDPAYILPNRAGYVMHQQIFNVVKKLKDGQGRYLWQPNTQAGMPPSLNGWPVYMCQSMDSTVASGKRTILFGKLDQYKVRRVREIVVKKLVERYAEFNQTGFLAFGRFDGALLDPANRAVKYLVH